MLEYRNITKKFGNKEAVKELTLKLKKGTIYGLLGENGSGKTTLMKMAAGLTQPTEGEILFEGHPLSYQDKASIAYMSTEPFFYSYMKVKDVEEYICLSDFFIACTPTVKTHVSCIFICFVIEFCISISNS